MTTQENIPNLWSSIPTPAKDLPQPGEWWVHKSGKRYQVLAVVNQHSLRDDDFPRMVIYQDEEQRTWARPIHTWRSAMTLEGTTLKALAIDPHGFRRQDPLDEETCPARSTSGHSPRR